MGCCHRRIFKRRVALQFLDQLFVLFAGLHARNADRDDLHTAVFQPLWRELRIQGVRQFLRVSRQSGIAYADLGDSGKSRLQRRKQLGTHLADQLFHGVIRRHIPADVRIEEQRICQPEAVFAKAADRDVHIQADILVHNPERNRRWRPILVSGDLFGIEIIDSLILRSFTAEGEALSDHLEDLGDALSEISRENGRLGGCVILVFPRLRTDIDDLALFNNQHALPVSDGNDRSAGDDVVNTVVPTAECGTFPSFGREDGIR